MSDPLKVTIAGGGVAGLAVGAALAGRGHAVRVAERAPEIREVGAGIQNSPNGVRVLKALGLKDSLADLAFLIERVRLIDGPSGRDERRTRKSHVPLWRDRASAHRAHSAHR